MSTKERSVKKHPRTCLEILNSAERIFVHQNTGVFIAALFSTNFSHVLRKIS